MITFFISPCRFHETSFAKQQALPGQERVQRGRDAEGVLLRAQEEVLIQRSSGGQRRSTDLANMRRKMYGIAETKHD